MRVRFLVGKRAGQIEHFPLNDNTVAMMLNSGIAEEVDERGRPLKPSGRPSPDDVAPPYFPEPVWAFVYIATTRRPAIRKAFASETATFANWDGYAKPNDVADAATKAGCPQEIVDRYLAEMKLWDARELANLRQRQGVEAANPKPPFVKVGW